jgi:hypothetical protein
VHSAASLSIGEGNVSRGQDNKDLFFPKPIHDFDLPPEVPVVVEGWAPKGVAGVKGRVTFQKSQKDFLLSMFDFKGGFKIRERDAHNRMKELFTDKGEDSPYSVRLVLNETQIKSWFSSEASRRKKKAASMVIERGLTELRAAIDLEKGGGDAEEENDAEAAAAIGGEEGGVVHEMAGVEETAAEGGVGGGAFVEGEGASLEGTLYLVGKELWYQALGFEVWELDLAHGPNVLEGDAILAEVAARKWVHENELVPRGQSRIEPTDLPDKTPGGGKLALPGERRFAPRVGRGGMMKSIEPGVCVCVCVCLCVCACVMCVEVSQWASTLVRPCVCARVCGPQLSLDHMCVTLFVRVG